MKNFNYLVFASVLISSPQLLSGNIKTESDKSLQKANCLNRNPNIQHTCNSNSNMIERLLKRRTNLIGVNEIRHIYNDNSAKENGTKGYFTKSPDFDTLKARLI